MNRENNSPFYSYNSMKNYNKYIRGVIYPLPDKKIKNELLVTPSNFISYSYNLHPICDGYYKINGSCSNQQFQHIA